MHLFSVQEFHGDSLPNRGSPGLLRTKPTACGANTERTETRNHGANGRTALAAFIHYPSAKPRPYCFLFIWECWSFAPFPFYASTSTSEHSEHSTIRTIQLSGATQPLIPSVFCAAGQKRGHGEKLKCGIRRRTIQRRNRQPCSRDTRSRSIPVLLIFISRIKDNAARLQSPTDTIFITQC